MGKSLLRISLQHSLGILCCVLALLHPGSVKAQPGYALTATSSSSNSFPLASTSSNRVQWIHYPSHFTPSLPGAGIITTMYVKASAAVSSTFTNLTIKLGNTTITSMSGTAWQTGLTTVFSSTTSITSTAANTWIPITLQSSFLYTGGNMIVEISQAGYTSSGMSVSQNSTLSGARQWGSATGSAPSGSGTGQLLVAFDIAPANCTGTPSAPVITNAAMSTAAPLCGTSAILTATNPNATFNGINLQWQSATSATGTFSNVTIGSGATTLTYTTAPVSSTTWYRLGATCTYSGITTYSAPYQVLAGAPQPTAITGRATYCPGDTANYSVAAAAGTTFAWTLPTGWTGALTGSTIATTMGASAGNISVTATNSCGTSLAKTLAVTAGTAPTMPTMVLGPSIVCPLSSQTFTTPAVAGATYYSWSLPGGWTGTSKTNSITLTTSAGSGVVLVKAANGCGLSPSANKAVSVTTSLASPGTITSSAPGGQYCAGQLYSFSINPVPGATSYQWNIPTGWSGVPSGTSLQAFATAGSGQVKVTAYITCGSSPTASLNVTGSSALIPSVTIATTSAACSGVPASFTASAVNGGTSPVYIWKKNGLVVAGTGNAYTTTGLNNGDVVSVSMTSNLACRTLDTAINSMTAANLTASVTPGVSISSDRTSSICSGTNVTFTSVSVAGGSAPAYEWYKNGVIIPGATGTVYTTSALAQGDTVSLHMSSNATCATIPVAISNNVGVAVGQSVLPSVSISASATEVVAGQTITFTATETGGGATPAFQWMLNNVAIPSANSDIYRTNSLAPGDHITLRMLSDNPCATTTLVYSNDIRMASPTSVASVGSMSGFALYPNPTTGRFAISTELTANSSNAVQIDVLNVIGQNVYHDEVASGKLQTGYQVQLGSGLANGTYTLRISTAEGVQAKTPFVLYR